MILGDDRKLDTAHLKEIMGRNALSEQVMTPERLYAVKEEMEKAEARKLQPYYIRAFFNEAFGHLGGKLRERETGRYEITYVPANLRERDRVIGVREPVLRKYERVCFEKELVRVERKTMATLLHPGHPLMQTTLDIVLEKHRDCLKQGAVLVDPIDEGTEPRVMLVIDHGIRDGSVNQTRLVSRRLHFVEWRPDGRVTNAGPAPCLDYQLPGDADRQPIADILDADWLGADLENRAIAYAARNLVPEHLLEVKARRHAEVDKTLAAVHERLVKEINYWSTRAIKLQEEVQAGKQPRMQPENARRRAEEVKGRAQGASTVTVTRNEILTGFNQPERYILALVAVGEHEAAQPVYVRNAFDTEPGWGVNSVNYDWNALTSRGTAPE